MGLPAGAISFQTVGASVVQLVGPSNGRKSIGFSCMPNARVTVADVSSFTVGQGINLNQGQTALLLRYEDYGDLVKGPWYAIGDAAGNTIGILEGFDGT